MKNRSHIIAAVVAAIVTTSSTATIQAQPRELAELDDAPQVAKVQATQKAKPTPLPAFPAGLQIGNRQIVRQDNTTPPAALQLGGFNLSALTDVQGHQSSSKSPLWVESDQSGIVAVCHDSGVLRLDAIQAEDDVLSVRVHDEQGNVATFAQRAYRTPYGTVESPLVSVRLDSEGSLLPLAVVRLTQAEDGSVRVTRDSDFGQALIVHFHLFHADANPRSYNYAQNVVIPAGEASAALPIQAKEGDVLTLSAGFSYTPAPAEQSDVIQF